ncbi:MAG: type II toxin-antitoxin system RelE/ParE family toxin [Chloroflexota bacterium]|nr:type II toxin-antitoxin system RelE/ParE family toxin [Chloroflexota bacterium]
MAYQIEYDPEAREHLRALRANDRSRVLDAIEEYLTHDAELEPPNRRRARMRANPVAAWRLRVDPQRVYYDVEGATVRVRAIGIKRGERVAAPTGEELPTHE